MSKGIRFTDEFKQDAVAQVVDRGYAVSEVATAEGKGSEQVAESFFQLLKRERIRRRTYATRDAARQDVFEYIEMFYNPSRKHTKNGMMSPVDYEIKQRKMNQAGV